MKTRIETKNVEKVITVKENAYILELTKDELIIIVASIGLTTDATVKGAIQMHKHSMDKPYELGDNYKIYRDLSQLIK